MDDTSECGPCIDHGIQGCEDCGHWQAAADERDDAYERRIADLTAERATDRLVLDHQAESIAALTVPMPEPAKCVGEGRGAVPGSRHDDGEQHPKGGRGTCPVCGKDVQLRYNRRFTIPRHVPRERTADA